MIKQFFNKVIHTTLYKVYFCMGLVGIFAIIYNIAPDFTLIQDIGYWGAIFSFLPIAIICIIYIIGAFVNGIKSLKK